VNHNVYLYAIVRRLPGRWRPPTAGLTGASVVPRRFDDLVVLTSLLETVPAATPRNLALHQDVVGSLVDATAALPMAYGTAVPFTELPRWVAERRDTVAAVLQGLRGCVEMTVKLLRLTASDDGELGPLAEALAERAALPQWRYHPSGNGGNEVATVAFLVPRADVAGFLARIAPVASHAVGVAVVPTGPWVPYSFVPDLGRTPRARVRAEAVGVADRRAG
jgi:hypothetical protein